MNNRASTLIDTLELSPHPEGGYFKEMYRSTTDVLSPCTGTTRNAVTDIYFLLISGQISRLHRVLHDEIWNFYEGDPLELIEIQPDLAETKKIVLHGNSNMPKYKHCVQGGNWQGHPPKVNIPWSAVLLLPDLILPISVSWPKTLLYNRFFCESIPN